MQHFYNSITQYSQITTKSGTEGKSAPEIPKEVQSAGVPAEYIKY